MNIYHFENKVSKVILSRGKNYYREDTIKQLKQIAANAWKANVNGTDEYFVYVELDKDYIVESVCTCPFDGTCKHEIAVYFAIRDKISTAKSMDLTEVFQQQTKEQLVNILCDIVTYNPLLQQKWLPSSKNSSITLTQAEKLINKRFNTLFSKRYANSPDVEYVVDGIYDVLNEAENIVDNNTILAVELVCLCALKMDQLADYCSEEINEQVSVNIRSVLNNIVESIETNELAVQITNVLLSNFQEIDNLLVLMHAAIELCPISNSKDRLYEALDQFLIQTGNDTIVEELKFQITNKVGTNDEILAYYNSKKLSPELRTTIIHAAMERKDYEAALALCADGIENNAVSANNRMKWLQAAYIIHGYMDNTVAQRSIAFELAVDCTTENIERLKLLYKNEPDIWREVLNDLLILVEQQQNVPYNYPFLLEQELQWERLLTHCRKNNHQILRFGQALLPHYPQEVGSLHIKLLLEHAENASNREQYRSLAIIINRMRDLGFNILADEMKQHLIQKYPRKKALHEELYSFTAF